ncbi:MAG TPA: dihydroorotase [Candidatus Marinimicrobia bacterium]|nr:dihydroorotase [Candidatus Neomarinimicrobiota bacterium]
MKISSQPEKVLFQNGEILDPVKKTIKPGGVLVIDGKIADTGRIETPDDAKVFDCKNLVITHGFCDLHVHFREPGREDKETLQTGSRAAMAGGFTRVCAMPNTNPPLDSPEAVSFIQEKSGSCPVHIHPIGAVSKGQKGKELTEMGLMKDMGAVAFSDDGLPIQDGSVMRRALEYATMLDVPIINHAEDECLRADGVMNESVVSNHLGLPGNPAVAESTMVHRDLELSELTGAKLHVPHVSTVDAIDYINGMKSKNSKVTAEVTPHHLYFNHEALSFFNTHLKVAPPIRSENDRQSLIAAVKDGTIDCIATDHAPHTIQDKETTFDLAAFGMIGLESCFGVVKKVLVDDASLDLISLISMMTVKPRNIMGFDSDLFKKGVAAELVVFDPNESWTFHRRNVYSRSINSPFYGKDLSGRVKCTISKGQWTHN